MCSKGEKITVKAHGGQIDIEGITVAHVNDKLQVLKLETFFDPLEMFRQITPSGVVNKEIAVDNDIASDNEMTIENEIAVINETPINDGTAVGDDMVNDKVQLDETDLAGQEHVSNHTGEQRDPLDSFSSSAVNGEEGERMDSAKASDITNGMTPSTGPDDIDAHLAKSSDEVHPHPKDVESAVQPTVGEAVAAPAHSKEAKATYEEMSKATPTECPFLMNRE